MEHRVLRLTIIIFTIWLSSVSALAQSSTAQKITLKGAAAFELPFDWYRVSEKKMSSIAESASQSSPAAAALITLPVDHRVAFVPVARNGFAGALIVLTRP